MTRRIILVTGSHRSGTSAITCGLAALGAELGNNLLGAIPGDNPKGFFEDLDVQQFNEHLLTSLHRTWIDTGEMPTMTPWPQAALDYALMLIAAKMGEHENFAVKDPRFARLMPFWSAALSAFDGEVGCVIALRNPLSVAYSLRARNGFEIEHGLRLWMAYTSDAITKSPQTWRKIVVDYDRLMVDWRGQLQRMARCFQLTAPNETMVENYGLKWLDTDLRHGRFKAEDLRAYEDRVPGLGAAYAAAVELAV